MRELVTLNLNTDHMLPTHSFHRSEACAFMHPTRRNGYFRVHMNESLAGWGPRSLLVP